MLPYFFGDPREQLLGVYHAPDNHPARDVGVVLCYPTGYECVGALRAYRVLARRLAKARFHTLRFDYYATGDSAGESEEADLDRWLSDVSTAVDELRASRDLPRVALVGLRLGATLAALVAPQRSDVESVVLWEPVVDGHAYLKGLRARHQLWLTSERHERPAASRHVSDHEVLGYPLTERLARSLGLVDLVDIDLPPADQILIIAGNDEPESNKLDARLRSLGITPDRLHLAEFPSWTEALESPQPLVPSRSLDAIVTWLTRETQ
jgi:alpha/beta superfamily hydrolase